MNFEVDMDALWVLGDPSFSGNDSRYLNVDSVEDGSRTNIR